MFRSSLLFIGICSVLVVCDVKAVGQFGASPVAPMNPTGMPGMPGGPGGMPGGPGLQPRQRDARPPANEAVATAEQEISTQVSGLLASINQGKEPEAAQLKEIADSLKKNQQYLQRMDAPGQANLQILNAWMNYFAGKMRPAKVAANAAYRADPQNKDAQTTNIVMLIANDDVKNAKLVINSLRKKAAKPSAAKEQQNPQFPGGFGQMGESSAILSFDPNTVQTDLLGEKLGKFDAVCLNGTSLAFKGGKTLLMLLWAIAGTEAKTPSEGSAPAPMMPGMGMPGMPGMMPGAGYQSGQTLSPIETFAALFAKEYQNNKVAFLGLNLNDAGESADVMATLMKNAWPWPQAMAQDSRNSSLASLAKLRSDKPSLVIVGPDGVIKYAGEFSGIVLKIMAAHAQSGSELAVPVETASTAAAAPSESVEGNIAESNAPPTPDANANGTKAAEANISATPAPRPTATPRPKVQKSDEEKVNPAASDLYQFALSQKRMAHITGYGAMVNACRQILKEYPDSSEAEKARQLLREVPVNKRPQYHITNEEMGL